MLQNRRRNIRIGWYTHGNENIRRLVTSGSITVAEAPYYNVFAFANVSDQTEMSIGIRNPGGNRILSFANTWTGTTMIPFAIWIVISGTTLKFESDLRALINKDNSCTTQGGGGIYKIYGVL